jgi:predicted nuclease of predicted toxin-antitoxin system
VKLLLDENLSPRLVQQLASLFPGLIHVRDIGLKQASDEEIWSWARENGCTIVTTDKDYVVLTLRLGWPPKVIHIEQCNFPFIHEAIEATGKPSLRARAARSFRMKNKYPAVTISADVKTMTEIPAKTPASPTLAFK